MHPPIATQPQTPHCIHRISTLDLLLATKHRDQLPYYYIQGHQWFHTKLPYYHIQGHSKIYEWCNFQARREKTPVQLHQLIAMPEIPGFMGNRVICCSMEQSDWRKQRDSLSESWRHHHVFWRINWHGILPLHHTIFTQTVTRKLAYI